MATLPQTQQAGASFTFDALSTSAVFDLQGASMFGNHQDLAWNYAIGTTDKSDSVLDEYHDQYGNISQDIGSIDVSPLRAPMVYVNVIAVMYLTIFSPLAHLRAMNDQRQFTIPEISIFAGAITHSIYTKPTSDYSPREDLSNGPTFISKGGDLRKL
ncbi:hypothetical protein BC629DRAFT_1444157 [Irpex lacteus]|nr:hypothetical protein BC629DRAFT_1444157 [Irpex lacteus]